MCEVNGTLLEPIKVGDVVKSKTGRDNGKYYVVYDVGIDGKVLLLVDGRIRSSKKPKRKNAIHVQPTHKHSQIFAQKKDAGEVITEELIREILQGLG